MRKLQYMHIDFRPEALLYEGAIRGVVSSFFLCSAGGDTQGVPVRNAVPGIVFRNRAEYNIGEGLTGCRLELTFYDCRVIRKSELAAVEQRILGFLQGVAYAHLESIRKEGPKEHAESGR